MVYRTTNREQVGMEMITKSDVLKQFREKQSALDLRWRRAADCSRGGVLD